MAPIKIQVGEQGPQFRRKVLWFDLLELYLHLTATPNPSISPGGPIHTHKGHKKVVKSDSGPGTEDHLQAFVFSQFLTLEIEDSDDFSGRTITGLISGA